MEYNNFGMNKKSEQIFNEIKPENIYTQDNIDLNLIYNKVNYYTMYRDKRMAPSHIKYLIRKIKHIDNINEYNEDGISFKFLLLSDFTQDEDRIKRLTSKRRFHQCHNESYNLVRDAIYEEAYVLTGYVNIDGNRILHSVAEVGSQGNMRIVDYTQNIVMLKNDYIRITNFKEISRVSREDINKDEEIIRRLKIDLPYYFIFRNEIINDLKKNENVLTLKK